MPLDSNWEGELILQGEATGLTDPVILSESKVDLVYVELDVARLHGAAVEHLFMEHDLTGFIHMDLMTETIAVKSSISLKSNFTGS
jgi:hypothetical protein